MHRYAIQFVPMDDTTSAIGVLADEGTFTLAELQEAATVGGTGYVEAVPVPDSVGLVLFVDEDGRMKGAPRNAAASALARRIIVGPALLVTHDGQGDTVGVPRDVLALILSMFGINADDHDLPD